MTWIVFAALVIVSSVVSYVLREQRHRRRWQLVDLPTVNAGVGAYREGMVPQGVMAEAPGALRALAFSCILYGRAFTFALLATALTLAGASLDALANPTLHAMLGYFVAGLGVGAIGVMVLSAYVMRTGSDLLVRDPRGAFARTRNTALASLALHGMVFVNVRWGHLYVGLGTRDASVSLKVTAVVAFGAMLHALALLGLAYAYRAELTARPQALRDWTEV